MKKLRFSLWILAVGLGTSLAEPAFVPDAQYTNELNNVRAQLVSRDPKLPAEEMARLVPLLARSNRLAQILPERIFQYELTNAAALLEEFPGTVDDLRHFGQPLLERAVNDGASVVFDFLLEHRAQPEPVDPRADPYLLRALQFRRYEMASRLVLAGASVTRTNAYGQSAASQFFESWYPGNGADTAATFLVPLMLTKGLDPFSPIRPGAQNSILEDCLARESGYAGPRMNRRGAPAPALVLFSELLLTNNPSPARRTPLGDTAIHLAVRWEYTNAIAFLLTRGFTLDQTNAQGLTPLQSVVGSGAGGMVANLHYRRPVADPPAGPTATGTVRPVGPPPTIVDWLLDHGATLDVFSAAGLGLTNQLAALLRNNPALANACDAYGRTPLHYAVLNAGSYPGVVYSFNGFGMRGAWGGPWSGPLSSSSFFAPGLPQGVTVQVPGVTNAPPSALLQLLAAGAEPSAATTQLVPQQRNSTVLPAGSTPLHIAARNGNTAIVRLLLNSRANAKVADADGNTPLHLVARTWQTNAIPMLLTARAPLEVTNQASQTPLRMAVESGVSTAAAVLLDAGANPTNGLGETTLMHLAAVRGDLGTMTVLRKHGFALEARDRAGWTPFQRAVAVKNWNAINFLAEEGANLRATNYAGDTALHVIAAQQDDTVYRMPDELALVRWQRSQLSKPGWTGRALNWLVTSKVLKPLPPLMWTNSSLSGWLVEHGGQVNATNRAGQTPLHSLFGADWVQWWYQSSQYSNRLANLLNAGASLVAEDTNGFTPLHLAATNAAPQIFKLILAKVGPAAVNQPDRQGRTMLHRAVASARDNFERISALLAAGANVNAPDTNGATALHALVGLPHDGWMYRRRELALMLLTNHANPNLADQQGRTPLFIALSRLSNYNEWNQRELITTLLTNGANPNLADRDGNTAVHAYLQATNSPSRFSFRDPMHAALKARADFSLTNRLGVTPLQLLAEAKSPYSHPLHMLTDFIDVTNAAFTVRGPGGNTPLHEFALSAPNCMQCGDMLGKLLAVDERSSLTNFSGQTPLDILSATHSRSWLAARVFSGAGANPVALAMPNASGQPLLHRMMQSLPPNNYDTQQFLRRALTNKSLLNLTNADGDTPLHLALRMRDSFLARQLVDAGADRKITNAWGETPIRLAAIHFPFGPTILNPPDTRMPFFVTVRSRGNNNEFDRWLDYDPGLTIITNRDGVTPLMAASEARNTRVVERLLALGAPLDALSALRLGRLEEFRALLPPVKRPLPANWMFEAVRFERLEGLQDLVANGCDVKAVDADGHSLLFHARAARQAATVVWLTAQGCRETLFDFIANNDSSATAAILDADKSLLEKPNDRGRQPIVVAVTTRQPEIVADLLARGAKPGVTIDDGWNLLHLAAATDAMEVARRLLKAGVPTNAISANSRLTPLHVAAIYGATNVAALLLENGAAINLQSEGGFNNAPLHWAAHMGQVGVVRLLLAHGADVQLKNSRNGGETALDLAKLPGNSVGMGFNSPPEAGPYPRRSQIPAEDRAEMLKLLEAAAAKP